MPGGADFVQKTVHRLETGHTRVWTKAVLAVVVIAALGVYHLYYFRGLATLRRWTRRKSVVTSRVDKVGQQISFDRALSSSAIHFGNTR
jgi:hypothetical protein